MITPEKINLILSILGILAIWLLWSFGLKSSLIDSFRHNIFEIRDEMFDYAADGNIDFNHPAYGTIRTLMNGYIRFVHKIDISILLTFVFYRKEIARNHKEFLERLDSDMSSLSKEKREELLKYLERAQIELGKHILFTSPLLILLLIIPTIVLLAYCFIVEGLRNPMKWVIHKSHLLDPMAFGEAKRSEA